MFCIRNKPCWEIPARLIDLNNSLKQLQEVDALSCFTDEETPAYMNGSNSDAQASSQLDLGHASSLRELKQKCALLSNSWS